MISWVGGLGRIKISVDIGVTNDRDHLGHLADMVMGWVNLD
jgi:hypothetical protein